MPAPHFTDHALRQMALRRIRREAVEFVCDAYTEHEYDPDNNSFEIWAYVAEGRLCVAVTAESFYDGTMVVKSAYYD